MREIAVPLPLGRAQAIRISSTVLWVAAITTVALALRLFWVFYTDAVPAGGDPNWYLVVGINLAKGFGYVAPRDRNLYQIVGPGQPTAFWPPGYPFAFAALFKLFGVSVTHAKVLNAALGAATVPFVFGLGSSIFGRRAGLTSALVFAVLPSAIVWTPVLFPEPLFTLLFVAALWLLVAPAPASLPWRNVVAFGLVTGMATLTRGEGAVLVPVAITYWLARGGLRPAARQAAVALAVMIATIAPWTIRNAVELHAFVPVSTNGGSVLRSGHSPEATGYTLWTTDEVNGVSMEQSLFRPDWEVESYRVYTRRAIGYAFTHPVREVQLSGLKLYHTYRSDAGMMPWLTTLGSTPLHPAGLRDALWYLLTYSYYVLFFATVASVPFWLRREPGRLLLSAVFVFWSLFHIVFTGDVRYHIPLLPLFAIALVGGAQSAVDVARGAFARLKAGRYTTSATLDAPIV